ncbi:glycosyltransferase family 4 protein [Flavobacterium sp. LB1P62]|uniref:glycosyltransferase family 4 protein n=1 Tax=Flavobacterium sp. LB1P62 TaxID=3401715 RepID=UPI003AB0B86D
MNILFLTLVKIKSLDERGIYTDLLRKFKEEGHEIHVVNPVERRENEKTSVVKESGTTLLNVRTLNIQKTNLIEKGVGTLLIERQYLKAIKKHFSGVKFDLIIYVTPPITFFKIIRYIKKRDNAFSYLLLKDIFPQNAVDMKMIKENGILHKFFLKKEANLYAISDVIGCMSDANKEYIIKHNPTIDPKLIEVNPNTISPVSSYLTKKGQNEVRDKHNLPLEKKIFVYGGNLGKPQGLDFLLRTILSNNNENCYFLIVGSGTEFSRIERWFEVQKPNNAMLISGLPKNEYDDLLQSCDIGLIFLHSDFTIPNFPSRLLSYLEMKKPIIAATDIATDIGKVIEKNNCGYWVISGDDLKMTAVIDEISSDDYKIQLMGENAWNLLQEKYHVNKSYALIINKLKNRKPFLSP